VGTGGVILYSPGGYTNVVITNPDGSVVTQQVSLLGLNWELVSPRPTINELQGVGVFRSTYIVSGGKGTILTSADGKLWTSQISGVTKMLSSVTASPDRAVIVGDTGTILTSEGSPPLMSWTLRNSGVTNWIYQARYLNGRFVAVGEAGLIMTSPDGITWTRRQSGTTVWLNAIGFSRDNYYAVGGEGTILKSPNAVDWITLPRTTTKSLYGVAQNGERVVVAGIEGAILRSRVVPYDRPVNFLKIGREATGLVFVLAGETDQMFNLQRSADLQTWIEGPDLEIVDEGGILVYFEGLGRGDRRFYRTRGILE
jgi:hypothetical protein